MNEQDFYPESRRSLDSLRHMRLMTLLRDMIDDGGKVKAAKALGVNYRTVSKAVRSGTLTDRMSDALERHLLLGGGSAAAQQRDRVDALVERVDAMEKELRGGLEAVVGEVKALREEHARSMRHVERRLVRLEAGGHGSLTPSPTGAEGESGPKRRYVRPRPYSQLVTPEAEPDEDLVYGEAAPVIVEWRRVRAEFLKTLKIGATLDKTEVQEPMLELEAGHRRGARVDAASGLVPLGPVRPAGSALGAGAGPQAGAGGAQPGVAASVAPARPHLRTVEEVGAVRCLPHGS